MEVGCTVHERPADDGSWRCHIELCRAGRVYVESEGQQRNVVQWQVKWILIPRGKASGMTRGSSKRRLADSTHAKSMRVTCAWYCIHDVQA